MLQSNQILSFLLDTHYEILNYINLTFLDCLYYFHFYQVSSAQIGCTLQLVYLK